MRLIKLGLANVNTTVGATRSNTDRVIDLALRMTEEQVTVACFSEQVIGGYPPEDLVQWPRFLDSQRRELARFVEATADAPMVSVLGLSVPNTGEVYNVAAVVHAGEIVGMVPKEKLPTYAVFYEGRTLSRGAPYLELDGGPEPIGDYIFEFEFGRLAVEVCEDVWSPDGPMRRRCFSGAEIVVNISASPYRLGAQQARRAMLATRSADNQVTLAYVNAVGAQDGLIYDGAGCVFQNGRVEHERATYREGFTTCSVDLGRTRRLRTENTTWRDDRRRFLEQSIPVPVLHSSRPVADTAELVYPAPAGRSFFLPPATPATDNPREAALDELFEALALGVKDYYCKTGAFKGLGVALSGGRDSMLTLLVAWRAAALIAEELGEDSATSIITAFYMPSRYSTDGTRNAAATVCAEIGVALRVVPIEDAYDREVDAGRQMLGGEEPSPITRQNVQARIRAQRMWNWANTSEALFLQTGDMSEKAVGYTTIGGDLEGALSVIANVPKTVVVALLRRLHARHGFAGIEECLATEPGPELTDDQRAEDDLMPFEVLDACLWLFAAEKLAPAETARALVPMFPDVEPEQLHRWAERFAILFTRSIYKWVQAPLALHVASLDLDRERALQLPVVLSDEWSREPS